MQGISLISCLIIAHVIFCMLSLLTYSTARYCLLTISDNLCASEIKLCGSPPWLTPGNPPDNPLALTNPTIHDYPRQSQLLNALCQTLTTPYNLTILLTIPLRPSYNLLTTLRVFRFGHSPNASQPHSLLTQVILYMLILFMLQRVYGPMCTVRCISERIGVIVEMTWRNCEKKIVVAALRKFNGIIVKKPWWACVVKEEVVISIKLVIIFSCITLYD